MGTIAVGQQLAGFQRMTPICGNCQHEKREHDSATNRTHRTCGLQGWFVLLSATCNKHQYKQKEAQHATSSST